MTSTLWRVPQSTFTSALKLIAIVRRTWSSQSGQRPAADTGLRFRASRGRLLCPSDRLLCVEVEPPGTARPFYRDRMGQPLRIGMRTSRLLRTARVDWLHAPG